MSSLASCGLCAVINYDGLVVQWLGHWIHNCKPMSLTSSWFLIK